MLTTRLQSWQGALDQLGQVEQQVTDLWRQAEAAYQSGPEAGDFFPVLRILDQIDARPSAIENTAVAIEATLPASQNSWQQKAKTCASEPRRPAAAVQQRSAAQGLLILRHGTRKVACRCRVAGIGHGASRIGACSEVTELLHAVEMDLEASEISAAV